MTSTRAGRLREHIRFEGWVEAEVSGDSMRPTLKPGDIVRLEAIGRARAGDILAFERGGGLLVHRVVSLEPQGYVCRGDNRMAPDGLTSFDEVIGCAVSVRSPDGGAPKRLPGGLRGRVLTAGPHVARRTRAVARRLVGEGRLLVSEVRGETPAWRHGDLGARWHGSVDVRAGQAVGADGVEEGPHVLQAEEVRGSTSAPVVATSAPSLVIAADTYCRLPRCARRALLRSRLAEGPLADRTVVCAFARTRRSRLTGLTALVRRALAAMRVPAGDPGDAVVPAGSEGDLSYARFFTAAELVAELNEAGAHLVALRPVRVRGVDLWRAEVRSSS